MFVETRDLLQNFSQTSQNILVASHGKTDLITAQ